jgi:hypothetical protein
MDSKASLIAAMRDMYERWEALLARLDGDQITLPTQDSGLSNKDVVAHLHAWQQLTIVRVQSALADGEPEMPAWLEGGDPEFEDLIDTYNARIYQVNQHLSWSAVHQAWKTGFLRLIELSEAVPEEDLLAPGRYPWLNGYPLAAVLTGTIEHHAEHLE